MSDTKENYVLLIRPVRPADSATWERMRGDLWPDGLADHGHEIASFFAGALDEPTAVLVGENANGNLIAFVELSIRTDLPSLVGTRAGYVEGLYVVPDARGCGVARSLLRASVDWARQQQCTAFASDRAGRVIIDPRCP